MFDGQLVHMVASELQVLHRELHIEHSHSGIYANVPLGHESAATQAPLAKYELAEHEVQVPGAPAHVAHAVEQVRHAPLADEADGQMRGQQASKIGLDT
jgi:hypothetical protein